MKKTTKGFFWHVHHDRLFEYSNNIQRRIKYIKENKPKDEIELRLKLMKPVKGKLPDELIKAEKKQFEFGEAWGNALREFSNDRKRRITAFGSYNEARKGYLDVLTEHRKYIEELHKKECPNCPWNGRTIFPKGGEK